MDVPSDAMYWYELRLEEEYINREIPDYSNEIDDDDNADNLRDERDYERFLDEN